ncbi:MAG TPA: phenylacetate--CoA ligase [Verrucomicrobiota bacterium]|jgi:phenylacetate-CoA ligase|nr:phenylacetate--CoA ligase [Verrucomicrobiota bacterium]OQC25425.1 MAG: Phenylacetate-coenzyme A ligase [Verrucomicrobia bacterium ADurb.Bin063]HCL91485.1 phenylacetate--CoA ligase [Limisphaerales bacterium]HRR64322.1 phenylacetate--CoA ligase [Candidatus Paceibacterota bacterium]MBP8015673.1 phenylacetate--CoA ligase [Verrucomicrobiota bacterium]
MFWDQASETLARPTLEHLQIKLLQETLHRVRERVPFYRQRLAELNLQPADIRTLAEVRRLPFTTSDDLRAIYPDGLLAVDRAEAVRLHTSSGTTGKPKAIFFSRADVDNAAELIARSLVSAGITAADVFQNMMSYGLFTGGLVMHYGAEKVGCLVIPAGPGTSERQLMLMQDFRTTAVHILPSYALYFASYLEQKGLRPRQDLTVRKAFVGAEPHTEETRRRIEQIFGCDVYNSYGLTEMNGPGVACECEYKAGMHLWEDNFLLEIINPVTNEPLPDGQTGELVLTTLRREAMPILRYRTRDITSVVPEPCRCGRTHRRLARFVGRADDMLIIRGVNIFPQQVERVLMSFPQVGRNYLIIVEGLDDLTIKVELTPAAFDGQLEHLEALQQQIIEKLRAEIWIRPKVDLVPAGSLPVGEGKAKRVVDKRSL